MVDYRRRMIEAARARGEPVGTIGPALGFRELKWLKPVYADDTIDYASEVMEARVSESRPGLGLMTIRSTGVNQNGDLVIILRQHHLCRTADKAMSAPTEPLPPRPPSTTSGARWAWPAARTRCTTAIPTSFM